MTDFYAHASNEPIRIIEANECEAPDSLTTRRFRRMANEINQLRHIIADVRVIYNSGVLGEFEGEPWLLRLLNIDLTD